LDLIFNNEGSDSLRFQSDLGILAAFFLNISGIKGWSRENLGIVVFGFPVPGCSLFV